MNIINGFHIRSISSSVIAAARVVTAVSNDLLVSASLGHTDHIPTTNDQLVDRFQEQGFLHFEGEPHIGERLRTALLNVDRRFFCGQLADPDNGIKRGKAARSIPTNFFEDKPFNLGCNAVITSPTAHAEVLHLLARHLVPGAHVLDVGSGSGYLTAVFAQMTCTGENDGAVFGIDHMPELVKQARDAVINAGCGNPCLHFAVGNGIHGLPGVVKESGRRFDVIHVGAAIHRDQLHFLLRQLAPGGRLIAPVRGDNGLAEIYDDSNNDTKEGLSKTNDKGNNIEEDDFSGEHVLTTVDVVEEKCPDGIVSNVLQWTTHGRCTYSDIFERKENQYIPHNVKLKQVETELRQWKEEWQMRTGRKPTRLDMLEDEFASNLFRKFSKLRKFVQV
eukprot:g3986.t1